MELTSQQLEQLGAEKLAHVKAKDFKKAGAVKTEMEAVEAELVPGPRPVPCAAPFLFLVADTCP